MRAYLAVLLAAALVVPGSLADNQNLVDYCTRQAESKCNSNTYIEQAFNACRCDAWSKRAEGCQGACLADVYSLKKEDRPSEFQRAACAQLCSPNKCTAPSQC